MGLLCRKLSVCLDDAEGAWCLVSKPAKKRKAVATLQAPTVPLALPAPRAPTPQHATALVVRGPTPDKPPPAAAGRTPSARAAGKSPAGKSPASAKTAPAPKPAAKKAATPGRLSVAKMTAAQKRAIWSELNAEFCTEQDELELAAGPS